MGDVGDVILLHPVQLSLFAGVGDDKERAQPIKEREINGIADDGRGQIHQFFDQEQGADNGVPLFDRDADDHHNVIQNTAGFAPRLLDKGQPEQFFPGQHGRHKRFQTDAGLVADVGIGRSHVAKTIPPGVVDQNARIGVDRLPESVVNMLRVLLRDVAGLGEKEFLLPVDGKRADGAGPEKQAGKIDHQEKKRKDERLCRRFFHAVSSIL